MSPKARKDVGAKIAGLVVEAERRYPGRRQGQARHRWVMKEAAKGAPDSDDPSAQFGRVLGATLLRIGIEIACKALDLAREEVNQ